MTGAKETTKPAKHPTPKPAGYWIVKIVLGLAIAGLATVETFTMTPVNNIAYALLGALAGGPEVVDVWRKGIA